MYFEVMRPSASRPNPQTGGPEYLSLSGNQLETCPALLVLPPAKLLSVA